MARSKGTTRKKDRGERREEALRPCHSLGYDRDALGVHLVKCGAYEIAESQLRRAVWLNPFQPRFKAHLAWCLYKQGRHADALACLAQVPETDDQEMREIARLIRQASSRRHREDQASGGHRRGI